MFCKETEVCLFDLLQTPEGVKIMQCVRQLAPEDGGYQELRGDENQCCLDLVIKNLPFTSDFLLEHLNCLMRESNMEN